MNRSTFKKKFNQILKTSKHVLITSHISPDDDSISSVLSLNHIIQNAYPDIKITMAYDSKISQRWAIFANFDQIIEEADFEKLLDQTDTLICLDANQYHRMTRKTELFEKFSGKKICIDHHKSQADAWDLIYLDTDSVAATEIIFNLFYDQPDQILANLLLFGILGDTGNLRFINYKQAKVFDSVKRLVVDGQIDIQSYKAKYDYFSKEAMEIAKDLVSHQQIITINEWPTLSLSYIDESKAQSLEKEFVKEGVNLYISSFGMLVKEATWSLTFYPVDDGVKLSGRSIPESVNVRKLFEAMEIGSGHDRASGAQFTNTLDVQVAIETLLAWLKNNSPLLD